MLKIALLDEERAGNQLMVWWNGEGAARVFAHDENAILMERAEAGVSLADMARAGRDDEASRVMCGVLRQLHAVKLQPRPALPDLVKWFEPLDRAAEMEGGIWRMAAETASKLLTSQHDIVVLHGDMHHDNVLRFGSDRWLAIDPKGIVGERGFDHANIFRNPDLQTAMMPGRLAQQIKVVSEAANLQPRRLLSWVLAWAGLSTAFSLQDRVPPDNTLRIAEIAGAELNS
jgi:streptomycin 6-kinase